MPEIKVQFHNWGKEIHLADIERVINKGLTVGSETKYFTCVLLEEKIL